MVESIGLLVKEETLYSHVKGRCFAMHAVFDTAVYWTLPITCNSEDAFPGVYPIRRTLESVSHCLLS